MSQRVLCAWATPSSQGTANYETVAYTDGTASCDCPGWKFQRKDKPRECKHTKAWHASVARIGQARAAAERRAMFRAEIPAPVGNRRLVAAEPMVDELPDGYRVIDMER